MLALWHRLTLMLALIGQCYGDVLLVDYFKNAQHSEVSIPAGSYVQGMCLVINPMRKPNSCSALFADGYRLPSHKLLSWGACIRPVNLWKKKVVLYAENMCPACANRETKALLDKPVKSTWQAVPCPVGNASIAYAFDIVNPWFFRLHVLNTRIPARKVEMLSQGRYQPMTRTGDGFWIMGSGYWRRPYPMPLYLRLTAIDGQVVTDAVYTVVRNAVVEGRGRQFAASLEFP